MSPSGKLTALQQTEAARLAKAAAADKPKREFTDAEKAVRRERVAQAKEALANSVGAKGDHVGPARAALKSYLQKLNDPKQPDDAQFEQLIKAPFTAPPKKKANDRRF